MLKFLLYLTLFFTPLIFVICLFVSSLKFLINKILFLSYDYNVHNDLQNMQNNMKEIYDYVKNKNDLIILDCYMSSSNTALTKLISFFSSIPYFYKGGFKLFEEYFNKKIAHSILIIGNAKLTDLPDSIKDGWKKSYPNVPIENEWLAISADEKGIIVKSPNYYNDDRNYRIYDRELDDYQTRKALKFIGDTVGRKYDLSFYFYCGFGLILPFLRRFRSLTSSPWSYCCSEHNACTYQFSGKSILPDGLHKSQATPVDLCFNESVGKIIFDEFK